MQMVGEYGWGLEKRLVKKKSVGNDSEKRTQYIISGNINWCNFYEIYISIHNVYFKIVFKK